MQTHAPPSIGLKRTNASIGENETSEGHTKRRHLANNITQQGLCLRPPPEEPEQPQGKNPKRVAAGRKGGLRRALNRKAAEGVAEDDRQGNLQDGTLGSGQMNG